MPALLSSSTVVVACSRLFGSMLDSIVQKLLEAVFQSPSQSLHVGREDFLAVILETIEEALNDYGDPLYAAYISISTARKTLHTSVSNIDCWFFEILQGASTTAEAAQQATNRPHLRVTGASMVADIEELIWSPFFGLNVNIDASVHLRVDGSADLVGPLELKTGSSSGVDDNSHSAQVMLYALQMTERYRRPVKMGMISYLPYGKSKFAVSTPAPGTRDMGMEGRDRPPRNSRWSSKWSQVIMPVYLQRMHRILLAPYLRLDCYEIRPALLQDPAKMCSTGFVNHKYMMQYILLEGGTAQGARNEPGEELFREVT